jgi:hypothetical protein
VGLNKDVILLVYLYFVHDLLHLMYVPVKVL